MDSLRLPKRSEVNSVAAMTKVFSASLLALTLAGCSATPPLASSPAEPVPAFAGAVSAADPRAQAAGEAMLARGGSATDAAIAVMLALTVVEPQSSGIGGGGFMVRGAADGTVGTFDGRETAPAGATPEWFFNEDGTLPSASASSQHAEVVGEFHVPTHSAEHVEQIVDIEAPTNQEEAIRRRSSTRPGSSSAPTIIQQERATQHHVEVVAEVPVPMSPWDEKWRCGDCS